MKERDWGRNFVSGFRVAAVVLSCAGALGCGERESSTVGEGPSASLGEPMAAAGPLTDPSTEQADAASVRAAYIATKQAEGATERAHHFEPAADTPTTAIRAANPNHRFEVTVSDAGVRLTSTEGAFDVGLASRGLWCDATGTAFERATPTRGQPNVATFTRSAGGVTLSEWYVNGPLGLEQGFDLPRSPCDPGTQELSVELEVSGRRPVVASDGRTVALATDGLAAPSLHIGDLHVTDATGRVLPSRFEAEDQRLALRVGLASARFPIRIDPLVATREATLRTGEALHASGLEKFGYAVNINGTSAIVGAPADSVSGMGNHGSAYVFQLDGNTWRLEAWLVPTGGAANDNFGRAVAIQGSYAVVGAHRISGTPTNNGAAYVFVKSGSTWSQQAKLSASDPQLQDGFGTAVALDGTSVVVGAPNKTVGANLGQGAGYVYLRSGSTWSQQAKLTVAAGTALDGLGASVALQGNTAVLGAPDGPSATLVNPGAVYVFTRVSTTWNGGVRLNASDAANSDRFGSSVALDGTSILVGAPFDDVTVSNQGSAYAFALSGGVWSQQAKIIMPGAVAADDRFGNSVAVSGLTGIVGAAVDDSTFGTDQGTAWVFVRSGSVWAFQSTGNFRNPSAGQTPAASDQFGTSVSISVDVALVGAPNASYDFLDQGTAAVFTRTAGKWDSGKLLTAQDDTQSVGHSVAIDGDYALLGAPDEDVGLNGSQGAAYVFFRTGVTWAKQARLVASDGAATDRFGTGVALSGNTALVGAGSATVSANSDQGAAYAFVRSGSTWSQQQKIVAGDGAAADEYGFSVALDGNTGVIGAPKKASAAGAVYVVTRSGSVWSQQQKLVAGAAGDQLGFSVGVQGDTAIAGANLADGPAVNQGAAYVFFRTGVTWAQQQKLTANDGAASDEFGDAVSVDGNTAVVGAPRDGSYTGGAYVYVRAGATWSLQAKLVASDAFPATKFGDAVVVKGDTVVVGSSERGNPGKEGAGYLFVRGGTSWAERAKLLQTAEPAPPDPLDAQAFLGRSVALSGDTALLGAPGDDYDGYTDHGQATVFRITGLAGQACSVKGDCELEYFCTENVCCTTECAGPCEACSVAKGATVNGTCKLKPAGAAPDTTKGACSVLCDGVSPLCPTGCNSDAECAAGKYCSSLGTCLDSKVNGAACDLAAGKDCKVSGCKACQSGNCVDGVCCATACAGGPCDRCDSPAAGTCSLIPKGGAPQSSCNGYLCSGSTGACGTSCTADSNCESSYYCAAPNCVPKKAQGTACSINNECLNGICADGVCCNQTCTGKCEACNAANKESGANSGLCEAAKKGTNPGNGCVQSGGCGEQPSCSGVIGVCAVAAFGTSCGPTSCSSATAVSGKICDGTGTCIDQQNADCTPYLCQAGACSSPCSVSAQCIPDHYCAGGFCIPKSDNGLACAGAAECKSSFCVDGVCCDSPCTAQCEACAETGSVGQCKPVTGQPRPPRADCSGTGACKGQCDGANPQACALPGAGQQCTAAQCTGDVSQPAGTCDGAGACSTPSTVNCLPYACDGATGVCKQACVTDGDCAQGSKCDTTNGKCAVAVATCKDAFTVALPNGTTESCHPYKCVGGACQQQCTTANDCADGYTCTGNACVPVSDAGTDGGGATGGSAGTTGSGGTAAIGGTGAAAGTGGAAGSTGGTKSAGSGDDGGCGCRVPGKGRGTDPALPFLAALGLSLVWLRRRRRPPAPA